MSFSLQWTRDGVDIAGATDNSYLVVDADLGKDLAFRVVGTNVAGSTTATSSPLPIPPASSPPVISGTPPSDALIGTPYAGFTPTVIGGTPPYTFSLFVGTLPGGLSLNTSTGAISGTTTANETQSGLIIRVTDAHSRFDDLAAFSITSALGVTPANFVASVVAASPGDTLILTAGSYGAYAPNNTVHHAAPGVSIIGSDLTVFTSISVNTCSGIAFHGMKVTGAASNGYAATCTNSQRVTFDGMNVDAGAVLGNGIQLRGSSNADIALTNNRIVNKGEGINTLDGTNLLIQGNTIDLPGNDGMLITGGLNITVDANLVSNPRVTTGHPDAIQFSTSFDTGARPTNVTITNNNFDRGTGEPAQFIFLERCDNVTIANNAGFGSMVNGVSASNCTNLTATNTFVQSWDYAPKFIVRSTSNNVTFTGDSATLFENYNGGGANTNVTINSNTLIPNASGPTDRSRYLAFLAANPDIARA